MADTKVKLDIETTADTGGVVAAERSLGQLEDELKILQGELRKLPVGSAEFTKMGNNVSEAQKRVTAAEGAVKKLGATMGRSGDAGRAVLSFSQAFEDAQFGIRGVLNNIPGLIAALGGGAGLAGVISIAAVAGSLLWENLGGGSAAAEKPVKDVTDRYKELLEIYTKFAKVRSGRNDDALEKEAAAIKRTLGGIDTDLKIKTGDNDLQSTIATLLETFKLTRDRVQLQALERQIASASGQALLDLSKNRSSLVEGIYQRELQIQKIADDRKLKDAQDKITAADGKREVVRGDLVNATDRANATARGNQDLVNKQEELTKSNVALIAEIERLRAIQPVIRGSGNVTLIDNVDELEAAKAKAAELQAQVDANDAGINRARAKRQAGEPEVEAAAKEFSEVTESYRQAVLGLEEARRNLETLSTGQDAQRTVAEAGFLDTKIQTAGAETAKRLEDGLIEVLGLLGAAAETPQVKAEAERFRTLAQGGITVAEQNEATSLLQQLLSKTTQNDANSAKALRSILGIIDKSVSLQTDYLNQLKDANARLTRLEINARNQNR